MVTFLRLTAGAIADKSQNVSPTELAELSAELSPELLLSVGAGLFLGVEHRCFGKANIDGTASPLSSEEFDA